MSNIQPDDQRESTGTMPLDENGTNSGTTTSNDEAATANTVESEVLEIPEIEIDTDDSADAAAPDSNQPADPPTSSSDQPTNRSNSTTATSQAKTKKPWSRRRKIGFVFIVLMLLSPFCCLWGSPIALNWLLPHIADQIAPVEQPADLQVPADAIHQLLVNFDALSKGRGYFTVADMVANWHGNSAIAHFVADNVAAICDPTVSNATIGDAGSAATTTCYAITRNSLRIYASLHHLQQ